LIDFDATEIVVSSNQSDGCRYTKSYEFGEQNLRLAVGDEEFCDDDFLKQKFESMRAGEEIEGELLCRITTQPDDKMSAAAAMSFGLMNDNLASNMKADFALIVDGKGFKCNKNILMAHSAMIRRMLSTKGVIETENNEIDRTGLNTEEEIQALLKFLYYHDFTAARENVNLAFGLLKTAHFYEIRSLEIVCEEILKTTPKVKFESQTLLKIFLFVRRVCLFEELRDFVGVEIVA
jgi:hypothetical protein